MTEYNLEKKYNWELANKAIVSQSAANSSESVSCGQKFGLNPNSIGPKVSFKKTNYATNLVDVIIPGVLEITRKNNQGIYNIAAEGGYNDSSPADTEWNSNFVDPINYGWSQLANVNSRTFGTWVDALNNAVGENIVGKELIMRSTSTGRIFLIMFTEWTANNQGGGFAYDRYEIFQSVNFYRAPNQINTVDKISEGLIIKRDNVGGIYNFALETEYNRNTYKSPLGTEWNSIYTDSSLNGWSDLSNVRNRKYSTWRDAVNANPPGAVSDSLQLVMHDLSTDLYWTFIFTLWGSGEDGSYGMMEYTRSLIPEDCGITFSNGQFMSSAPTAGGNTPVVDIDGNVIVADSSNYTVNVGPGSTQQIQNFSGMLIVNDHYDGGVETWIAGGGDTVCLGATNTRGGPVRSTLSINGTGYEWTNVSGMTGPFTFTVIKTRDVA